MLRCTKATIRYSRLIFSKNPKNSLSTDRFGHLIKQDALSLSFLHVAACVANELRRCQSNVKYNVMIGVVTVRLAPIDPATLTSDLQIFYNNGANCYEVVLTF